MATSSVDVVVAEMLETTEFLKDYVESVEQLLQQGLIPDLDQTLTYKVYRIKGSSFVAHESIVLAHGGKYFTVELGFINVEGVTRTYPVTRPYNGPTKKLEYCGEVTKSGSELLGRAVRLMQKFGTYTICCNNCQRYCNVYLCDVGLGDQKKLTDSEKGFLLGAGAFFAAGFGFLVYKMLQPSTQRR